MSTDDLISKGELSRQVEEYIKHRINDRFYDPCQSICVVQVHSGNPLRICDANHYIEVSDPAAITSKLKAALKNVNWNTMKGSIVRLKKWRFTSSFDDTHDKLKLEVVIDEVEYLQGGGVSCQANLDHIIPLTEAPELKGKLSRLKKHHIAEEFNTHHPIEAALDLVDLERQNRSEIARFADTSRLRGPAIGASLESNKDNGFFWNYEFPQDKPNQGDGTNLQSNISATAPGYDERNKYQGSFPPENKYQSLPDNRDIFMGDEKFESQIDPFQSLENELRAEDELEEYKTRLEEKLNENEPIEKEMMELEKQITEKVKAQAPVIKRKFQEVLEQKKESINNAKAKSNKASKGGSNLDNEQQNFRKQLEAKKSAAKKQDTKDDTLDLLGSQIEEEVKVEKAPIQKPEKAQPLKTLPAKKVETTNLASSKNENKLIEKKQVENKIEKKRPESKDIQSKRSSLNERIDEEVIINVQGKKQNEVVENNNEYLKSFKLIKSTPLKKEEKECKQSKFITKDIELETKKKVQREKPDLMEEPEVDIASKNKKVKPNPSSFVENPLDKKSKIDLNDFKLIKWKPSSSSLNSYVRTKDNRPKIYEEGDNFL